VRLIIFESYTNLLFFFISPGNLLFSNPLQVYCLSSYILKIYYFSLNPLRIY